MGTYSGMGNYQADKSTCVLTLGESEQLRNESTTNVWLRKNGAIPPFAKTGGRLRGSGKTTFILPYLLTSSCCLSLATPSRFPWHRWGRPLAISFLSHRLEQRSEENGLKAVKKATQQGIFAKSQFTWLSEM